MSDIYRRCGCRDDNKRQLASLPVGASPEQIAKACPKLVADPKHGSWGFYLAGGVDPLTDKRVQVRKAGFATKRDAQQARNDSASKIDKGTYRAPSKVTFGAYVTDWLPRHSNTGHGLKPTTQFNYERYIRMDIVPSALGRMLLTDVRRHNINAFAEALVKEGRGATTVRRIVAVVQSAVRAAYDEQLIGDNPAIGVRLPRVEAKSTEAWSPAQVGQFLDTAASHRLSALFELVMFTGLRRGEALGLHWADIDFDKRTLSVRTNRTQVGAKAVEQTPKSKSGARTIEIADATVGALLSCQLAQEAERAEWGEAWVGTGYVFTKENGAPLLPQYATRLFDKIRLEAKLPKMTFHGQRHQAISLMLSGGVPLAIASKRAGHSSVQITADLYGHMIGSASKEAAEIAVNLVPRSTVAHTLHTQGG